MCSIRTSVHSVNIRTNSAFGKIEWMSLHVTSRLSCRVFNPHSGTFGKYSGKFAFRKYWITVPSRHFTTIMLCVQSTLRNIRWIFGQIQFSKKFGLRIITVAFGHTLFFIAWIKFDFFIIFWWRHVLTITFVIIRYTKNCSKYPYQRSVDCNTCRNDVACSLERRWIAEGTRHRAERQNS